MANDDFRVPVEFADVQHQSHLARSLNERELAQELREALGDRLIVSEDGPHLFLYAGNESDAGTAEKAVSGLISQHELSATVKPIERWHPIEKAWKDASLPLPESDSEQAAEHERWEQREAADSRSDDLAEWEVKIDLGDHDAAEQLAKQLEQEGVSPIVRRWKYLLVGAANEDSARALAKRLESELPAGAELTVEPTPVWIYEGADKSPLTALFVMFGGLPRPDQQD